MANLYFRNEDGSLGKVEISGGYDKENSLLAHEFLLDMGKSIDPPILEVINGGRVSQN